MPPRSGSARLMEPAIERILREGRQAHVAVVSARGPHVTPELYAWAEQRLWVAFAHTTLKARVLSADPRVAVLVAAGGRSAVVEGTVDLFDLRRPQSLIGAPVRGLRAARGIASYAARNAEDLVAFARDLAFGRLGRRLPPSRVLAAVDVHESSLIEDGQLIGRPDAGVSNLRAARDAPDGGEAVVVALPGPQVAPGRWFADRAEAWVDPVLLDLHGVHGSVPIAVVADEYVAPGPAAKVGTLRRGTAVRVGATGALRVVTDVLTAWDGVEVASHRVGDGARS